ncbi:hypothetical protein BU116_08355 [Staphylococcus xylosus]|nr:hypothetical protein BU116_08355 [Staphylococcus xylosus]
MPYSFPPNCVRHGGIQALNHLPNSINGWFLPPLMEIFIILFNKAHNYIFLNKIIDFIKKQIPSMESAFL